MSWQRARQPEQKAERVSEILQAAAALFDEQELAELSMREIAGRAGLGKASLYSYFKTKEEVFLSLYREEFERWLVDVETRLGRLRRPTPARVATVLADVLRSRPRYCRLNAILSSVIERNLAQEVLIDFKASFFEPLDRFIKAMRSVVPDFSNHQIRDFLFQYHAMIAGLWPMTHPPADVEAVLKAPEFHVFRADFFSLLERTLQQLLETKK